MKHAMNIPCPNCQKPMELHALHCSPCDLTVSGKFEMNEFATLSPEDLQFLRVFLHAEGRIREMEGPLGLSYPTIRGRLAQLKEKVFAQAKPESPAPTNGSVSDALAGLERGDINFEDALKIVKKKRK